MTLTDPEFWRLRARIDALGDDGAAKSLGVTNREMCDAIYPGTTAEVMEKVRRGLSTAGAGVGVAGERTASPPRELTSAGGSPSPKSPTRLGRQAKKR